MSPPPAGQLPPSGRQPLPYYSHQPSGSYSSRIRPQMRPHQERGGGSHPYLPRSNTEPTLPSSISSAYFSRPQEDHDQQIYYDDSLRQPSTRPPRPLSHHHVQLDYEGRYHPFPEQDQQQGPSSHVQYAPPPPLPPPHHSQFFPLESQPRSYFPPPSPPPPIRNQHSYSTPVPPLHYQQQHHPQPHSPPSPFTSYSNLPPWPSSQQFGASPPTHQPFLPPSSLSPVSPQTNLPPPSLRSPSSYTSSSFQHQTSSSSSEGSTTFAQLGGQVGDDEVASETGLVFASLEVGDEDRVASLRQTVSQTGIWLNENVARHGKAVDREGSSGGKAPGKRRMTEAELLQEDQDNDPNSVKRRLRNIQNSRKFRDKRKEYIADLEKHLSSTLAIAESLLERVEMLEGSSSPSTQPKQEENIPSD